MIALHLKHRTRGKVAATRTGKGKIMSTTRFKSPDFAMDDSEDSMSPAPRGRPRKAARQINEAWFTERLKEAKLSMRALASMLAKDVSALSRTFSGSREATAGEVAEIASTLGVSVADVLTHLGYDAPRHGASVIGEIRPDGRITASTRRSGEFINIPSIQTGARLLICRTAGGPLAHWDGACVIYYERANRTVPADAIGRICVIEAASELVPIIGVLTQPPNRRGGYRVQMLGSNDVVEVQDVIRASPVAQFVFGVDKDAAR